MVPCPSFSHSEAGRNFSSPWYVLHSRMAEFVLLVILLMVAWDYFTDWRDRQAEQKKREQKVALRQKHLSFAADAPSAWEAYGDALRQAGFLSEAILAFEEAKRRLGTPSSVAPSPVTPEGNPELPGSPALASLPEPEANADKDMLISGRQSGTVNVLLSMGTISDPLYEERSEIPALIVPASELVPVANWEEENALAVVPDEIPAASLLVPAFHVDASAGYGLDNKIRLVQLEIAQNANPEKYGHSIATREQTCRMCGFLNGPDRTHCANCGIALPVQTFLDTLHSRDMRQEFIRDVTRVGLNLAIVFTCIWFVSWLDPLAKFSIAFAALIVIPMKLLQRLGDPQEREL